jgi:hypothetical protein
MRALVGLLFLLAAACAPRAEPDLNPLAEQYVRMSLEIGTHEEGYIDAYYGPPEWKTEAEANPRSTADLKVAADELSAAIATALEASRDPVVQRRARTLAAYVSSAPSKATTLCSRASKRSCRAVARSPIACRRSATAISFRATDCRR